MSSLRNAAKRVTHKERGQPAARKRFGFLEKHKDYVERARDFQKKEKIVSNLRSKAENRNPDEFYFNMNKSKMVNGKHEMEEEDATIDAEDILLLKSQDMKYVQHKRMVDEKKIEKLRSTLHMIHSPGSGDDDLSAAGSKRKRNHILFAESEKEVESIATSIADKPINSQHKKKKQKLRVPDIDPSLRVLSKSVYESANKALDDGTKLPTALKKKIYAKSDKAYAELAAREKRADRLKTSVEYLQQQKNLMSKGSRKKLEVQVTDKNGKTVKKTVYKWKRERAR